MQLGIGIGTNQGQTVTNGIGMVHELRQMSTNEAITEPIKGLGHMVYLVYLISLFALLAFMYITPHI